MFILSLAFVLAMLIIVLKYRDGRDICHPALTAMMVVSATAILAGFILHLNYLESENESECIDKQGVYKTLPCPEGYSCTYRACVFSDEK